MFSPLSYTHTGPTFNRNHLATASNEAGKLEVLVKNAPSEDGTILVSLFHIYKYLEDRKDKNKDPDQIFRRKDFIGMLRAIENGSIDSFGELENFIYKTERIDALSKGYSKEYLELSIQFLHAVFNSNHQFSKIQTLCRLFLTALSESIALHPSSFTSFLSQIPYDSSIGQNNEIPRNLSTEKFVEMLNKVQSHPSMVDSLLNEIESLTSEITIKTLLIVELHNKNSKGKIPVAQKNRILDRLNKVSSTTTINLGKTSDEPSFYLPKEDYARIFIEFGRLLAIRKESGFTDTTNLLAQTFASNNEAQRLVYLGALTQLNDNKFYQFQKIHHRAAHHAPFGRYLQTEKTRCLYTDLIRIQQYFEENMSVSDHDQMIRRKDFIELISRIHYGLIKDIRGLQDYISSIKRKCALKTGRRSTYFDLTESFFQRSRLFNDFNDVKNACDAYVLNYNLNQNLGKFSIFDENGVLLSLMQDIEKQSKVIAFIPFDHLHRNLGLFIPSISSDNPRSIIKYHVQFRSSKWDGEATVNPILGSPFLIVNDIQLLCFIKNLISHALCIPDFDEALKYLTYAKVELANFPKENATLLLIKTMLTFITTHEINKRNELLKNNANILKNPFAEHFNLPEFLNNLQFHSKAYDYLDTGSNQFTLSNNQLNSTDKLFEAFGKILSVSHKIDKEMLFDNLFNITLQPRLKIVLLHQLDELTKSIDVYDILFHILIGKVKHNKEAPESIKQVGDAIKAQLSNNRSLNYFIKLHEIFIYLHARRILMTPDQLHRRADFISLIQFVALGKCHTLVDLNMHLNDWKRKAPLIRGFSKNYYQLVNSLTSHIDDANLENFKIACEQYIEFLNNYTQNDLKIFCQELLDAQLASTKPLVSSIGMLSERPQPLNLDSATQKIEYLPNFEL